MLFLTNFVIVYAVIRVKPLLYSYRSWHKLWRPCDRIADNLTPPMLLRSKIPFLIFLGWKIFKNFAECGGGVRFWERWAAIPASITYCVFVNDDSENAEKKKVISFGIGNFCTL